MSLEPAIAAGLVTGLGLLLIAMGLRRRVENVPDEADRPRSQSAAIAELTDRLPLRVGFGLAAAVVMGILALWPVAIVLAFLGGYVAPTIAGAKSRREAAVSRTEAIASWAEQLRDVIGSAAGLQEAISVTADLAPIEIRTDVQQIRNGLLYEDLPTLLRQFAERVDDPAADQIVVSLVLAATRSSGNLTELLNETAVAARAEASMRMRMEVSRAQSYADAKAATYIVLGMFGFLLLFNSEYLEPYGSFEGQLVLGAVGLLWAFAVQGLAALARVRRPERVLVLSEEIYQ
jgi:hypothetical protein